MTNMQGLNRGSESWLTLCLPASDLGFPQLGLGYLLGSLLGAPLGWPVVFLDLVFIRRRFMATTVGDKDWGWIVTPSLLILGVKFIYVATDRYCQLYWSVIKLSTTAKSSRCSFIIFRSFLWLLVFEAAFSLGAELAYRKRDAQGGVFKIPSCLLVMPKLEIRKLGY